MNVRAYNVYLFVSLQEITIWIMHCGPQATTIDCNIVLPHIENKSPGQNCKHLRVTYIPKWVKMAVNVIQ